MTVTVLIEWIANNGALIVIGAIFLFIAFNMFERQNQQNARMFDRLMNTEHTESKEEKAIEYEKNINDALTDTLYSTDAARAFFIRYHNGNHDLNGMAFLKMSMTNEIVRPGIAPMMADFSSQFRSVFNYPLDHLREDGDFYVESVAKLELIHYSTYLFLNGRGVTRCYLVDIKNAHGRSVGCIGVEYMKENVTFSVDDLKRKVKETKIVVETLIAINSTT